MIFYRTTADIARKLRKEQTPEEKIIWELLRNRRLLGFKFLRQHPIVYDKGTRPNRFIVADFFCAQKKLIVEVDGIIHDFQKQKDKERDVLMLNKGYKTLRIENDELVDIIKVIERIKQELNSN